MAFLGHDVERGIAVDRDDGLRHSSLFVDDVEPVDINV